MAKIPHDKYYTPQHIGDKCYYINGENGQWVKVALVEVVEFKPRGIVCKFINCSLAEHQKNNYRSDDSEVFTKYFK